MSLLLILQDKFLCIHYTVLVKSPILILVGKYAVLHVREELQKRALPCASESKIKSNPEEAHSFTSSGYLKVAQFFSHVLCMSSLRVSRATAQATAGGFLYTSIWLTLVCWKWDPIPIPDGEPGEGTGEVLGEGWRLPVISIMSCPMSFSSSSGKGRSNMSSKRDIRKRINVRTKGANFK